MTKRMLQPMQLIEVKLLLLFKGDFILILPFIFGHSGQVNRGPKKHVSFLESSKDSSPLVISDSLTIDNSIMASFECTAEFDIELIESIKQHPCLYNKNYGFFNASLNKTVPWRKSETFYDVVIFIFLWSKVFIFKNTSVSLPHLGMFEAARRFTQL